MNKLTDNQKRLIALGVGILMVLLGVVQAIFKPPFLINNRKIVDEGTFILMMVAAMLLFSIKRKPKPVPEEQKKIEEQVKPEELTENQPEEKK
jgi:glucan phosphoethanolaminetransferase (alkaline phosphatase superfamily)